jgi:hypothetical protein
MYGWNCPACDYSETDRDRGKVDALRDYHMRSKHGSKQVASPSGPKPRQSTGSTLADAVGDFFEGAIDGIFKIFD